MGNQKINGEMRVLKTGRCFALCKLNFSYDADGSASCLIGVKGCTSSSPISAPVSLNNTQLSLFAPTKG